jgi:hypothetical protein
MVVLDMHSEQDSLELQEYVSQQFYEQNGDDALIAGQELITY